MILSPDIVNSLAESLFEAEKSRKQVGLLTAAYPQMTIDDAYAVQARLVELKLAAGREQHGWKIGLTSKAMQYALNIDIPDSGILFDDMFFKQNSVIPDKRFIQTRIEAEIAFIMARPLKCAAGESPSRQAVIEATESIAPALEILDTRIVRADPKTGASRKIFDTISDNAANAGIVLGDQRHRITDVDLRWVGAIVEKNGEVEETGLGAGVLNDPVTGIVWLVERLAEYGKGLEAGDVVLSGSFIRPVEAGSGDRIDADFGSFGSVNCSFA